ncbi:hypothetical protein ACFJIV_00255 [Mucilaginibacter sp. UC70_90]
MDPAILNNGNIGGFNNLTNGYALGWPTVTRPDHPAVGPVGGGRSAVFVYLKDDLSIVVLTNLMGANPDRFIDEIAGYYIPEMHEVNGFGLSPNLKKLRTALLKQDFKNADAAVNGLKKKDVSFKLSENELNGWGYQLLSQKKQNEALSIFALNTILYPNSANAYDSYGEALELAGEKEKAVVSYKKSLQLNAGNKNAAERVRILSAK